MIEYISRVHANRAAQVFSDTEGLGDSHVRSPRACVFESVQSHVAPSSRQWVLKNHLTRLPVRDRLQRAQTLDACRDRGALRIFNGLESVRLEIAAVHLAASAWEEPPANS